MLEHSASVKLPITFLVSIFHKQNFLELKKLLCLHTRRACYLDKLPHYFHRMDIFSRCYDNRTMNLVPYTYDIQHMAHISLGRAYVRLSYPLEI
jgi:hypothetical protein